MARIALLIGNSTYQDCEHFSALSKTKQDVTEFAQVLKENCGFDVVNVLVDKNHTEIMSAVHDLYENVKRGDLTLLYFSGHGGISKNPLDKQLYLIAPNTEYARLSATSISQHYIMERRQLSNGRHHIIILDCCYSGAFVKKGELDPARKFLPEKLTGETTIVLASSSPDESSYIGTGGVSLFTRFLIEGIKISLKHKNEVSFREVYEYAYKRLKEKFPQQEPAAEFREIKDPPWFAKVLPPRIDSTNLQKKTNPKNSRTGSSSSEGTLGFIILVIIIGLILYSSSQSRKDLSKPENFVRDYYQKLDNTNYQEAWKMLSPEFIQKKGPNYSFEEYRAFWDSVEEVSIRELSVADQKDTQAVLKVHMFYKLKSGAKDDEPNFCINLDRATKEDPWLLQGAWNAVNCIAP